MNVLPPNRIAEFQCVSGFCRTRLLFALLFDDPPFAITAGGH